MKLALLGNQWQSVVRRAQQRRGIIDSLVHQWQNYQEMSEKLLRWLQEVTCETDVHQPGEPVALQQARNLLDQTLVGHNMQGLSKPSLKFLTDTILIQINSGWIRLGKAECSQSHLVPGLIIFSYISFAYFMRLIRKGIQLIQILQSLIY